MYSKQIKYFGLVDADLLDNGTRHPNLVLMKIAGYLRDHGHNYELIINQFEDIDKYDYIYESRVFSFTKEPPFIKNNREILLKTSKLRQGGTGYYSTIVDASLFEYERRRDMLQLELDPTLPGFNLSSQMPDYTIYEPYIEKMVSHGKKRDFYKDYLYYSIGFLTRGCIRHCPFCVNKNESKVFPYSKLSDFWDKSRPYVYLWDDNFLASPHNVWRPLLEELIETKRPFQFRQGLDIRLLTKEKAELLSKAHYHGDMIFAFDQWKDKDQIIKHLKIWKFYSPKKTTKLYLFCGFEMSTDNDKLYNDIYYLFLRIGILMQYGCLGYVMRHSDYKNHPLSNIYVQIARWCNQPQFYKKMSFWEFIYRNQSYYEEKSLGIKGRPKLKTFSEFEDDVQKGYYKKSKMCLPLKTFVAMINLYPEHKEGLLEVFNYKMLELIDPSLWKIN